MQWKTVTGNPKYEVSDCGNVRNKKTSRVLRQHKNHDGYNLVYLYSGTKKSRKSFYVHRIVCEAFCGLQPSTRHVVAHGDGSKDNNHFTNLRWATTRENYQDSVKHGTSVTGAGERNGNARLTSLQVKKIRDLKLAGYSSKSISDRFSVSTDMVNRIARRDRWAHI